jgi:hypothetical protein
MELQWNLCPFCGNQHVDPYQVGPPVVLVDEIIGDDSPIPEAPVDHKETVVESSSDEDE